MKFNKWTVGLAAVGVVSLASAARAEEKVSTVMTALSSTTLSGYVDTSAQWNFGTGNARLPDYKFGGSSKADGFNLDVIQIRIEKPLDEAEWAAVPKEVRRCRVANDMRSDTLLHTNESSMFSEHVLNAIHRKSSP